MSAAERTGRTSGLLHCQLVTDLLLVVGQVFQGLLVEAGLPQDLVLVEQQLAVLVVHLVWRRLQHKHNSSQ